MKKKINKYDITLIIAIIIINILLLFYGSRNVSKVDDNIALVYSKNELVGKYILSENYENEFTINSGVGHNTIKIKDKKIWIEEASCPDQICTHQGKISSDGEIIVCLPNQLLIKIEGNSNNDIDFIAP